MIRRFIPGWAKRLAGRLRGLDEMGRLAQLDVLRMQLDQALEAIGRVEARQLADERGPLQRHEFRVSSHAGEDGIIQFLVRSVPITSRRFVEFGVEDYREANTRFLLTNNHWSGLVLDGSQVNVDSIHGDPVFWNSDLTALCAFVTRENVNELIAQPGFDGEIGLLSIDVDGNDYWIFDAVEVVRPAIVIAEYNHRFGSTRSVTIPYDPTFVRRHDDASWLWAGASLQALDRVASRKGLALVGCNSFGNNAFFVRDNLRPSWMPRLTASEAFVKGQFRESLIVDGNERVLSSDEEAALLETFNLVEVE